MQRDCCERLREICSEKLRRQLQVILSLIVSLIARTRNWRLLLTVWLTVCPNMGLWDRRIGGGLQVTVSLKAPGSNCGTPELSLCTACIKC